jgi:hypothetical protein
MKKTKIKYAIYLAICLFLVSTLFHVLSYFPSLRTSNDFLIFLLTIGVFPTFILAIKSNDAFVKSTNTEDFKTYIINKIPPKLKVFIVLVVVYVFFNFFSLIFLNSGLTPNIIDEKYFLGDSREITEEQYYKHKAYLFRGISGHSILFQLISITILNISLRKDKIISYNF